MARTYATQTNAEPISAGMLEQFGNFDNYSIVSGCAGTFSAVNLTVTIASGTVVHNGSTVTVAGNSVTIVPDVTAPLWAWIGINSSGTAAITHGTAAATPTVPALGDVVPIYLVYVQANLGNANAATYKLDKRVIYSGLKGILTTSGDMVYASAANTPARLAKGTARQALIMDSSAAAPSWAASLQSLMTGTGDIVYSSSANTPARLAAGSNGQVLTLASGIPSWATPSGSEWVKVAAGTFGAVSSVTLGSLSGYQRYRFAVWWKHSSSSGEPATSFLRFNGVTSASYYGGYVNVAAGTVTGGNINGSSSLTLSTATGVAGHTHALVADIQLYANSSSDSFRTINAVWQLSDNNGNGFNHASFGGGALVANSSSISEILINFGVTQTDGMYLLEGSNSTS